MLDFLFKKTASKDGKITHNFSTYKVVNLDENNMSIQCYLVFTILKTKDLQVIGYTWQGPNSFFGGYLQPEKYDDRENKRSFLSFPQKPKQNQNY